MEMNSVKANNRDTIQYDLFFKAASLINFGQQNTGGTGTQFSRTGDTGFDIQVGPKNWFVNFAFHTFLISNSSITEVSSHKKSSAAEAEPRLFPDFFSHKINYECEPFMFHIKSRIYAYF